MQNFYHYGDKIGTQVKDSIVQRSNIGTGAGADVDMNADTGAGGGMAEKKCPTCSTVVEGNGKYCNECGAKL